LRTAAVLDGDIRRERGRLARRRVVDHFSLESAIAQYAQLYDGGAVKG
jgi:glycosyltransferase involved in cell wall biosynthesis